MVVTLVTRNRKIKVLKVAKNLKGKDEWKHVLIGERETVSIQKRTRGKKGKGEKHFSSSRAALQSPGRTRCKARRRNREWTRQKCHPTGRTAKNAPPPQ